MVIKKGIPIKDLNQQMDIGKYYFHFNSYKVGNTDLVYEALRLIENREINIFNYKIKTYRIEDYILEDKKRYKIKLEISKKETQYQTQAIPVLSILLILTALGLIGLIAYGILFRIEKILAEIPDVALILVALFFVIQIIKQ